MAYEEAACVDHLRLDGFGARDVEAGVEVRDVRAQVWDAVLAVGADVEARSLP